MPTRTIELSQLREEIAHEASRIGGAPAQHFLELIGPVEITMPAEETAGWHVSHYAGSADEIDAIEKAVAALHRKWPIATRDVELGHRSLPTCRPVADAQ